MGRQGRILPRGGGPAVMSRLDTQEAARFLSF